MQKESRDFLGSGWKFPPRLDSRGRIELVHHEQDIEEAIRIILLTRKGERPMRPEFGSELHKLNFMPCDATTAGLARRYIQESLARWEPRIKLGKVEVTPANDETSSLLVNIQYMVRSTNNERNLVFPYYTIPGED